MVASLPGSGEHRHVSDSDIELLARFLSDCDMATVIEDCYLCGRPIQLGLHSAEHTDAVLLL